MVKKIVKELPYDKAIGNILGIVNCLLVITDVDTFRKWFRKFHLGEISDAHLLGYKLTLNTLFRMLTSEIERNTSLGLSSDDIFERATFRGITINKVPNTCEKAILMRNLQSYYNQIIDSNNWDSLEIAMQRLSTEVLHPFNNIKKSSSLNREYPLLKVGTAVTYSSMFQIYIFLNDTSRNSPHGYLPSMLDDQDADFGFQRSVSQALSNSFFGYKYAVQFLWYRLFGDTSVNSIIKSIHKTQDWSSFDTYFGKIQSRIIKPLEKTTGGFSGYDYFIVVGKNPKKYLNHLIEKKSPERELSLKDYLERVFLWYPIHSVNCYDYDFGGIPVLIPLLKGMAMERVSRKNKEKIKLLRLVHGKAEDHRRDYSYAVFIGFFGMISDASGWMLFFDCCSDQGSSSGLFQDIESKLVHYQELGTIDIQSIRIDKSKFVKSMKDNVVSESILEDEE